MCLCLCLFVSVCVFDLQCVVVLLLGKKREEERGSLTGRQAHWGLGEEELAQAGPERLLVSKGAEGAGGKGQQDRTGQTRQGRDRPTHAAQHAARGRGRDRHMGHLIARQPSRCQRPAC